MLSQGREFAHFPFSPPPHVAPSQCLPFVHPNLSFKLSFPTPAACPPLRLCSLIPRNWEAPAQEEGPREKTLCCCCTGALPGRGQAGVSLRVHTSTLPALGACPGVSRNQPGSRQGGEGGRGKGRGLCPSCGWGRVPRQGQQPPLEPSTIPATCGGGAW